MDLGSFVREKRRAQNLSQQQLADRAGVGLNFVYQFENGKTTVQLDCVLLVLNALGYGLAAEAQQVVASVLAEAPPRIRQGAAKLPWD